MTYKPTTATGRALDIAADAAAARTAIGAVDTTALNVKADCIQAVSGDILNGQVIHTHPESTSFDNITHLLNDLMFTDLRGGSVTYTIDGSPVAMNNSGLPENPFRPDVTFARNSAQAAGTGSTIVAEVTTHRTFRYTTHVGIVMPTTFRARDVTIEVFDVTAGIWRTIYTTTNESTGINYKESSTVVPSGNDISKVRYTLTNFATTNDFRITSMFAVGYNSLLLSEGYLPRSGGSLYGTLTADAFIPNAASTVTAAGSTTLSIADKQTQVFTGSTTQTVKLPTTGIIAGYPIIIINNSTGTVTVQSSGSNSILSVAGGRAAAFAAKVDTPTGSADWVVMSVQPSATAQTNTAALRDDSGNILATGFVPSLASTATAAGTTALNSGSAENQIFTGSTTQTVTLPTTGVVAGQRWTIINLSSGGNITVNASGGSLIFNIGVGHRAVFTSLQATPTTPAHWSGGYIGNVAHRTTVAASTVPMRDTVGNIFTNAFIPNLTSTATAAGTTTLTTSSTQVQVFTGSTTQTVVLPTTASINAGQKFEIINLSTGSLTINSSGGNLVKTVVANTVVTVTALQGNPTTAAHWYANSVVGLADLGVTATAAELNALDGITATVTELNYTDGVTSDIQGQLNAKAPIASPTFTGTVSGITKTMVGLSNVDNLQQQPINSDLTAIAAIAPTNDDIIQRKAGAWTNRTMAQVKTDLVLVKGDVGLGNVDNTSDVTERAAIAVLTNKDLTAGTNTFPTLNQNTTGSAAKWTTARNLAGNSVDGSAAVNFANKFIVQGTVDAGLTAAQFLGALGTGLVKNTTTTGVLSIGAAGTDYYAPGSTDVAITDGGTGASTLPTGLLKGAGTGAITAGSAGSDYVAPGGALGTPSSGTLTSCTGLPIAGLVASTATAIGVGTVELGHATDTTLSRSAVGKLAVEGIDVVLLSGAQTITGKTLTSPVINTPTGIVKGDVGLGNVDNTSNATERAAAATLTSKRITKRVNVSNAPGATPTLAWDSYDVIALTGINAAITSMSSGISGAPTESQPWLVRFKDDGTPRAIAWGASYRAIGVTLPTTTVANKTMYVGGFYNNTNTIYDVTAVGAEA